MALDSDRTQKSYSTPANTQRAPSLPPAFYPANDPSGKSLTVKDPILTVLSLFLDITVFIFTGITPPGGNAHHSPS
ncbi:MAG: hypothetical protein AAFP07_08640 [Cyanobacteria bacterium J06606_4]